MRDTRCLVTGASGFLGRHLLAALAREGAEVVALSRAARDPEPVEGDTARWLAAHPEDPEALERALDEARPEVVFHLASLVSGRRDLELVLPAFQANLESTVNLLAAATRIGCRRIVLAGSMEEPEPGSPPPSPYAAAKAAASVYAGFFHAAYATPVVTARIFMVYGPGQLDVSKLVPSSILTAIEGRRPKISSGKRDVDWVHVEDVARGLVALAVAEGIEGTTLDLGSGRLESVREVVERICRLAGVEGPEVGALPDRPGEVVRRADPEATAARTGWRSAIGLDDGLAGTVAWYRAERAAGRL